MFSLEVDQLLEHGVPPKTVLQKLRLKYRAWPNSSLQDITKFLSLPSLACLRDRKQYLKKKIAAAYLENSGRQDAVLSGEEDEDSGSDAGEATGPSLHKPMTVPRTVVHC